MTVKSSITDRAWRSIYRAMLYTRPQRRPAPAPKRKGTRNA